jgi:hypothetical protein
VRPAEEGADIATISKDLIQRANLLMPIFKVLYTTRKMRKPTQHRQQQSGVSSSDFVQLVFAYASHLVLDWDLESHSHLHLVMLLADMIKFQLAPFDPVVLQKDYGTLVSLLQAHYSEGLGNVGEQKLCIQLAGIVLDFLFFVAIYSLYFVAEPIVYALCYLVTLAGPSAAAIDNPTTLLLRQLLLSSQLLKESLAKKVSDQTKTPSPTAETAAQKKALIRNYRASQNIYNMVRVWLIFFYFSGLYLMLVNRKFLNLQRQGGSWT